MRPDPAEAPRVDAVRREAPEVAAGWSVPGAPPSWALTAALFRSIADDPELLTHAAGVLGLVENRGAVRSGRLLCRAHPAGSWLQWLDPATAC